MEREIVYSKIKNSVEQFGTPQFIFFEDKLRERVRYLKTIFQKQYKNTKMYYSYKTNYLPEICKIIYSEGIGAEVSNLYDLNQALTYKNNPIIFDSPAKTKSELNLAIENKENVILNIDNLSELKKIIKLNRNKGRLGISVRLSHKSRFGVNKKEFKKIQKLAVNNRIDLIGLHLHTRSEQRNSRLFLESINIISDMIKTLDKESRQNLEFINLGGGFGVEGYLPLTRLDKYKRILNLMYPSLVEILNKKKLNFNKNKLINDNFVKEIISCFSKKILTTNNVRELDLIFEPGRWLINPVFYFLTRVSYRKDKWSIILDSSITHGFQQDLRHFRIFNTTKLNEKIQRENIYGCSLLKNDFLGTRYQGGRADEDNIFLFKDTGAYTLVHSSGFKKPLPQIIYVKNGKFKKLNHLIK